MQLLSGVVANCVPSPSLLLSTFSSCSLPRLLTSSPDIQLSRSPEYRCLHRQLSCPDRKQHHHANISDRGCAGCYFCLPLRNTIPRPSLFSLNIFVWLMGAGKVIACLIITVVFKVTWLARQHPTGSVMHAESKGC